MRIVMLGGRGISTNIVYNALTQEFDIEKIIIEDNSSGMASLKGTITFLKKRIKKLGLKKVLGQILFKLCVLPLLKREAAERVSEIIKEYKLNTDSDFRITDKCIRVPNFNSEKCIHLLKELSPDVIIVNGTRILSKNVLESCPAVFINMHAGITPKYRGVHGAYWAFYEKDSEYAGVTVHYVDTGIDTGGIIMQDTISITKKDNFVTYPFLQTAKGVQLELKILRLTEKGETIPKVSNNLPSVLRTHPTIGEYLRARWNDGVR